MRKIKKIINNISVNLLLLLVLLVFFLIILSILEMIGLASIPILLSSILSDEGSNLNLLNFFDLKNKLVNYSQKDQIKIISIFIVSLFAFKNIFHASIIFFQGKIVKNIKILLSKKLFKFYLNQDYLFLLKKNSSEMLRTISIDVGNTTIYILNILNLIKEILILLSIIFLLLYSDIQITVFLFTSFFIIASLFYYINKKKLFNRGKIIQKLSSELIRIIYETVGLFKELKIYNLKVFQYKYFLKKISETEKNVFFNYFTTSLPRLFLELAAVTLIISIILIQLNNNTNILDLLPYLSLVVVVSLRLIPLFNGLTTSVSSLKTIQPSFDLVFSELEKINNNDENLVIEYLVFNKKISFRNIDFEYQDKTKVFENININVNKGEKIGIIGPSGSGKSTLVNLLIGLLKPNKGEIFVDDIKISRTKPQLIKNISYVPQEIFLIEDEIKKNIALGIEEKDIDDDRIKMVAQASQIDTFIENLNLKYETKVIENGKNFSVGQRQRIGVARALYRNPDIIIFDESTSSLDLKTEEKFIEDIYKIFKDKTIIFISHKISALKNCDKIFDLKKKLFLSK
ncbi:MAG: hypothetical protein CMF94_05505 [Candidatus Marinimicrobia bacterium]|nr:hypothetical protein [Candidatus Neomarinimicrobiota bacterium]